MFGQVTVGMDGGGCKHAYAYTIKVEDLKLIANYKLWIKKKNRFLYSPTISRTKINSRVRKLQ